VANAASATGILATQSTFTIAHILPFPSVGGTEHATLRIVQAIDPRRFGSIAFCLHDAKPVRALFEHRGIPCLAYDPPVPSYRHGLSFLRSSLMLARAFRRSNADLIHCADLEAAHQVALAGWLARLPVLCHIRNRFDEISRRDRSFLWPVDKFVFVSHDTWRRFGYPVGAARGLVIYDGIEDCAVTDVAGDRHSVRREFNIPDDAPIIGMMARVAPQKDFATLARAAIRILEAQPDTRFLVAGDYTSDKNAAHYQRVRADLEACGVARAFIFTGLRNDVPRLMNALDVFVLSTHCEGLPLVILEAMAHGKPVVATAVDGIPEVVRHGESGLLVPHEDHEALAAHVLALLRDPAWSRQLGAAGAARVRSSFSRTQFADAMNSLYQSMAGRRIIADTDEPRTSSRQAAPVR
jgi:glycosyltransferase involved in cell wall biosynthesis